MRTQMLQVLAGFLQLIELAAAMILAYGSMLTYFLLSGLFSPGDINYFDARAPSRFAAAVACLVGLAVLAAAFFARRELLRRSAERATISNGVG